MLDCTGHARKLVTFDEKFDPGYQAAYGMMIEVESHPFELDTMLFMDWRDDHTQVHTSSLSYQQLANSCVISLQQTLCERSHAA